MLVFEKSRAGRGMSMLPACDVEIKKPGEKDARQKELHLPQMSENDLSRHYTELAKKSHGVNDGFYPLGSCTMKYNPKINEDMAALPGFTQIHPLQPEHSVQGCLEVLKKSEEYLCEITGMDGMTFQPAAGAHGEFTGLMLIKAYHESRGDEKRTKIIVPDSAHGTNPASATMAGYKVVSVADYEKPEETGLPAANVLIYKLENNETVIVRPSGTEPKIKIYYTTLGKDLEEAQAEKDKLAKALEPILA